MFATVKYSNKELFIHTNCVIPSILDYIKTATETTLSNDKEYIDLASENGDLVYDLSNKGRDLGKRYLDNRSTFILVKAVFDTGDDSPNYVPLADVSDKVKQTLANNPRKKRVLQDGHDQTSTAAAGERKGRQRSNTITGSDGKKQAQTQQQKNK